MFLQREKNLQTGRKRVEKSIHKRHNIQLTTRTPEISKKVPYLQVNISFYFYGVRITRLIRP